VAPLTSALYDQKVVQEELEKLGELRGEVAKTAEELMARCNGEIFPCDALASAALSRAFNLIDGFGLLVKGGNYQCAVGLLRFQLDNVLRLFGVTTCGDAHGIASDVLTGTPLARIKHDSGQKMHDAYLVELLSERNPWVQDVYRILSGFIHLSDTHFQHMLMQSVQTPDGTRKFHVSDTDNYVPSEHKVNLVRTFATVTRGVVELVQEWASKRDSFGQPQVLRARFKQVV